MKIENLKKKVDNFNAPDLFNPIESIGYELETGRDPVDQIVECVDIINNHIGVDLFEVETSKNKLCEISCTIDDYYQACPVTKESITSLSDLKRICQYLIFKIQIEMEED